METEARLMQNCFMHHYNKYPSQRGLLFKVKNEGRNRITGARDKATGLIPGVSDMIYLLPYSRPIFIEFKTEAGRQSPNQKKWQCLVEANGYQYFIIRDLKGFEWLCQELNQS